MAVTLSYRRNLYGLMAGRKLNRRHPLMPPRPAPTPHKAPVVSLPAMAPKFSLMPPWVLAIAVVVAILFLAKGLNQYTPADHVVLKVYGGQDNGVYLGCLNCDEHADDSMTNAGGQFGDSWSPLSLANHAGKYGAPVSDTSACDPTAGNPPVVEDGDGRYLGRLTVNPYDKGAFTVGKVQTWLRYGVCGEPVTASSSPGATPQTPTARPAT